MTNKGGEIMVGIGEHGVNKVLKVHRLSQQKRKAKTPFQRDAAEKGIQRTMYPASPGRLHCSDLGLTPIVDSKEIIANQTV